MIPRKKKTFGVRIYLKPTDFDSGNLEKIFNPETTWYPFHIHFNKTGEGFGVNAKSWLTMEEWWIFHHVHSLKHGWL